MACENCGAPSGESALCPNCTSGLRDALVDKQVETIREVQLPKLIIVSPGNGTKYILVVTPLGTLGRFDGDEGHLCHVLGLQPGSWLVSLWPGTHGSRCAWFAPQGYLSPMYVSEKLNVGVADAEHLARIIAEAIGRES